MAKFKKGNKVGKRFTKGNKVGEKWTEGRAIDLGNELLDWMLEDESNIFYQSFIILEKGHYPNLTSYLSKKFKSFRWQMEHAKSLQEIKLLTMGTRKRGNASMIIWFLTKHHGYSWKGRVNQQKLEIVTAEDVNEYHRIRTKPRYSHVVKQLHPFLTTEKKEAV